MAYENSNLEKVHSYQKYLEENINLTKLVGKLETMINRERAEKNQLQSIYEDFKLIHEKTRKELQDMNIKLSNSINEKLTLERRYKQEFERQKEMFDRQKESYENQILKLSAIDIENLKTKIILECEAIHKDKLDAKENEVENLLSVNADFQKKYELLLTEYDTMKIEALKEIDLLKDSQKSEIRELLFKIQLLTDKNENSNDREPIRELKNNYELVRKQNLEYLNEISNLRREKDMFILEKNEVRLSLMKEADAEKMKYKVLEAENERKNHILKNVEYELNHIKSKFEEKSEEIKYLIEEKYMLAKQLRDKELDFESFKAEIKVLRQKIDERDKEINTTLIYSSEKEKHHFIQEKTEKEGFISEIERLSLSLKENQIEFKNFYERANAEIQTYKRDFYIVSEEKRNLQSRVIELQQDLEMIRDDYERKYTSSQYLEKELSSLQDKYRELTVKESESHKKRIELETTLKKKSEDLEEAHKYSSSLVKMQNEASYNDKRMKDLIMKKEYYKQKVRKP